MAKKYASKWEVTRTNLIALAVVFIFFGGAGIGCGIAFGVSVSKNWVFENCTIIKAWRDQGRVYCNVTYTNSNSIQVNGTILRIFRYSTGAESEVQDLNSITSKTCIHVPSEESKLYWEIPNKDLWLACVLLLGVWILAIPIQMIYAWLDGKDLPGPWFKCSVKKNVIPDT